MAKSIKEVMTPNPKSVDPSTTVVEAARLMRDLDVGPLPVVEDGKVVGIVTDPPGGKRRRFPTHRDIVVRAVAEGKDPQGTKVGEIASTDLVTVDPQQDLDTNCRKAQALSDGEALRLMARHQVRRLPVVEEDGRLVGVAAQADVTWRKAQALSDRASEAGDEQTGEMVEEISK